MGESVFTQEMKLLGFWKLNRPESAQISELSNNYQNTDVTRKDDGNLMKFN